MEDEDASTARIGSIENDRIDDMSKMRRYFENCTNLIWMNRRILSIWW